MKYFLLSLSFIILLSTSCSFQQKFHFNNDWSGSSELKIDMSQMIALSGGVGGAEEDSLDLFSDFKSENSLEDLGKIPGITNVRMDENSKKGIFILTYNFENIDALNKSMASSDVLSGASSEKDHNYFSVKKNKLIYQMKTMDEEEEVDGMKEVKEMKEMFKYDLIFSFEKSIKKIKSKNIETTLSNDKKIANCKIDIFKMIEDKGGYTMIIQLEK